jgi:hypothetical protein
MEGDRGRIAALSRCFAEDGVLDAAEGPLRGRGEIIESLSKPRGSPNLEVVRHHLTTHWAELDEDGGSATGRTYFAVMTNIGVDHHGVYVDRYRKIDGRWLIAHRRVRIDWQSPHSLFRPLPVRGRSPRAVESAKD